MSSGVYAKGKKKDVVVPPASAKATTISNDAPVIIYDFTTTGMVESVAVTRKELNKEGADIVHRLMNDRERETILKKDTNSRYFISKGENITVYYVVKKGEENKFNVKISQAKSEKEISSGLSIVANVLAANLVTEDKRYEAPSVVPTSSVTVLEILTPLQYKKATVTIDGSNKDVNVPIENKIEIVCGPKEHFFLTAELPPYEFKSRDNWFTFKQTDSISNVLLGVNYSPMGIDSYYPYIHGFAEVSKRPFHSYGIGVGMKIPCLYKIVPIVVSMNTCWVDSKHNPPWKFAIGYNISKLADLLK